MTEHIKILHVEDEEIIHRAIMRFISKKGLPYNVDRAARCSEAMERLENCKYDIVLLDYLLPDGTGLDLLEKIKDVPVIFLTGSEDPTVAVKAMKNGAYDYLIKELGLLELLPVSIDKTLKEARMEREHREMEERIAAQNAELAAKNEELARLYEETKFCSLHDPLTGVGNRRFMESMMEKSIETAKRYDKPLSLIMFDIDHFKRYNDTCGHDMGDKVLAKTAGIVSKGLRSADSIFRYGGEEFIILLPEIHLKDAYDVAERLRNNVESEAGITISLGISTLDKETHGFEMLIKKADKALYRAKENGRNRVEIEERQANGR